MADGNRISELLSAPIEAVITALGVGIARAQRELDRSSLEVQREINEDPALAELGLQATWYQIPRAEIELTTAITMEERKPAERAPPVGVRPPLLEATKLKRLYLQPVNASYQNQFSYDAQASSRLRLTILPVPPPGAESVVAPRLPRDEAIAAAKPALETSNGEVPADTRLTANFNGQVRLWFVLQYRAVENDLQRLALVVVDDATGAIVKQEKGGSGTDGRNAQGPRAAPRRKRR